jgi:signal transduction histidine kinase
MHEMTEMQSARRIACASDRRRRQVERAIHDGVQQHLTLVGLKLALLSAEFRRDPDTAEQLLGEVSASLSAAQREMRELAHWVYPVALENEGLVAALSELSRRPSQQLEVRAAGLARHSAEIETAVYFCCLEALDALTRHAAGAGAGGVVTLSEHDGCVEFAVSDDGGGVMPHDDLEASGGLQHVADRLTALGGQLELVSIPGGGVTVHGSIPIDAELDDPVN